MDNEAPAVRAGITPALDDVFELLASRCRRYILYYLYNYSNDVASVDDIAAFVHTNGPAGIGPTYDDVESAVLHVHVPKLADAGIVDYDGRSRTVRYRKQPSLEEWLEHAHHKECSRIDGR
jgi:DNA-binding transcriptional ArsR family regulator